MKRSAWPRWTVLTAGLLAALVLGAVTWTEADSDKSDGERTICFSKKELGKVPKGWTVAKTGKGEGSVWKVVADETSPSKTGYVLAQTAKSSGRVFNLCVVDESSYHDVEIEVAFKSVRGKIDQGGGPVWRYQDADNYYIARFNPLEDNYRFYKVVGGRRRQLATSEGVKVAAGEWHTLRIIQRGNRIQCYLNGKLHLDLKDDTFTTSGKVGLWTKADAVTYFDDLAVRTPSDSTAARGSTRALVWECGYTASPPNVDGVVDEVWQSAKPLTVVVREAVGGHNPRSVTLRALRTNDRIYVLAQWPDGTKSDMRDPYVWEAKKGVYQRPSKPDDQFALEFPMSGQFDANMLALSRDYVADVWHWKAGRGNPVGWVDDKRHVISQHPTPQARTYSMGGHGTVYIARLMDAGTASYLLKPRPGSFQQDVVDSFTPSEPTGSLADVRGKGLHDGKSWTLEMTRRLDTGHDDDAVINPKRRTVCAIAVLDDELYWRHSVSPEIIISFSDKGQGDGR